MNALTSSIQVSLIHSTFLCTGKSIIQASPSKPAGGFGLTQSSSLSGLAALRIAKAKAAKSLNLNIPFTPAPQPVAKGPEKRRRLTYVPLQRETKLLQSYTETKMFEMGEDWGSYGRVELSDGRRASRRNIKQI